MEEFFRAMDEADMEESPNWDDWVQAVMSWSCGSQLSHDEVGAIHQMFLDELIDKADFIIEEFLGMMESGSDMEQMHEIKGVVAQPEMNKKVRFDDTPVYLDAADVVGNDRPIDGELVAPKRGDVVGEPKIDDGPTEEAAAEALNTEEDNVAAAKDDRAVAPKRVDDGTDEAQVDDSSEQGSSDSWVGHSNVSNSECPTYIRVFDGPVRVCPANEGFVVTDWASQISVLSHPSTGAFVSHCGWNSILESLWCGVPMVAWPIQAEQKMNSLLLVKQVRVAIEVKMEADGFVPREEVEWAHLEDDPDLSTVFTQLNKTKGNAASMSINQDGNSDTNCNHYFGGGRDGGAFYQSGEEGFACQEDGEFEDVFDSDLIWRKLIRSVLEQSLVKLKSSQGLVVT